jgi:ABC-type transporter Mla subunit MlaD
VTARDGLRGVAAVVLAPGWRRLRPRIETIAREIAGQAADAEAERRAAEVQAVRDELRGLHEHVERLVGDMRGHQDDIDNKLRLMAAQLAATDARVAELERPAVDLTADGDERAEARRLIEEIRAEHGRARSRLAAVAFYEERIARLERAQPPAPATARPGPTG